MPTKTKKQKMAALERKWSRLQADQTDVPVTPSPMTPAARVTVHHEVSPVEEPSISYFFTDLKKSLVFIVVIIALEFVLYFVSIKYRF